LGVASRRASAETVRVGRRSVRGRPASRHRCRRSDGLRRPVGGGRGRLLHGANAAAGDLPDHSNRGRLVGHARPPRFDRGASRNAGRRRRRRRHDRPERRARGDRAVRPPRRPSDGGPERLRRPLDAPAPSTRTRAAAGPATCTAARDCAGCGAWRFGPSRGSTRLRTSASSPGGEAEPRCASFRERAASRCDADASEHEDDDDDDDRPGSTHAPPARLACAIRGPQHIGSCLELPAASTSASSAGTARAERCPGRAYSAHCAQARGPGHPWAGAPFEAAPLARARPGRPCSRAARAPG
jgi:hypothetical protein